MTSGPIGEAHVLVSPDLSRFGAELRAKLDAAFRSTRDQKVKVEFDLDRSSLNRVITQAKTAARGAHVELKVDVDRNAIRTATRDFDLLGGKGRSALRSLNREVFNSNIRLREMANILGGATLPVLVSLASVGIAAFGSLAAAAASAAAAVSVLPGLIGAAIQGLGVGALAFSGLGDAVKAMGAAQESAGTSALSAARKESTAADAIKAAQRGVRDALEGVTDAQRGLNDARRDARQRLIDLRFEEIRLSLDLRGATLGIKEAEADLFQVTKDSGASALERRKAQLAVDQAVANQIKVNRDLRSTDLQKQQAQLKVEEARAKQAQVASDAGPTALARQRAKLRVEEAKLARDEITRRIALNRQEIRSGVEGSEQVVAAKERQRDAAQQLRDAQEGLAKATRSATLAVASAPAPVNKLTQAMEKLSPAGQRFARFLFGLRPKFLELRSLAQAGLFPGLESAISRLVDAHFPLLRRTVDATARTLGGLAREGAALLASGPFRRDFAQFAADNVRILQLAGRSSLNLADAFRNVTAAARPLVLTVARMVLAWTANVKASAAAGRESGKLGRFFRLAGESLASLLRIAGNVGRTLGAVLAAAFPSGAALLTNLEAATGRMRELATSTRGGEALREFFDKARPAIETIGGLIVTLARKLFEVVVHVKTATEAFSGFLERNPQLKDLLGTVLALAFAFKAFNIAGLLGAVGAIGQLTVGLVAFNPVLAVIVGAVLALGAAVTFAFIKFEPFRSFVTDLAGRIRTVAAPILATLGERLRAIGRAVGPAAAAFGQALLPALRSLANTFRNDVMPVLKFVITAFGTALFFALTKILPVILRLAGPVLGLLLKGVGFIIGRVFGFIVLIGRLAGALLQWITRTDSTGAALRKLGEAAKRGFDLIVGAARTMIRFVLESFGRLLDGAVKAFGWIPGIGGKLKEAQRKFKGFREEVNLQLGKINHRNVIVTARGVFKAPKGIVALPGGGGDFSTKANNRARGGPIFGPGTGTSDDVPIWASHGEHVWTAAEVAKAGGHHVMEAWRRSIRGYASGGAVEDAPSGRFRVTPRLSSSSLEEGIAAFDRNVDRFALALGKNLGKTLFGAGGAGASGAVSGAKFGGSAMSYIADFIRKAGVAFQIISGFRPGARTRGTGSVSLHALGRALDLVGSGKSSMMDIWAAATRIPFKKEVIFSPAPFQVYGSGKHPGPPNNPRTRADHYNHVHVGLFDRGGFLMPGLTLAENRSGKPERVEPAGTDILGRTRFGQGLNVENLIVQPITGRFRLADVMTELRLQGVH